MTNRLLAACLAPICAFAQVVCSLGPNAAGYKPAEDQRPSPDAMQVAARMNAATKIICGNNCPQLGVFRNATAAGAMLVLASGEAKLVYSPQFFAKAFADYGDLGLIAIFAHKMGHALDDTMGAAWVNQKWAPEVRADSWAGCLLGRMKLKDADLASTLAALSKYPSPAHPAWTTRLPAIRTGYSHCGGTIAAFNRQSAKQK
jgi:hypothetical protein